MRTVTAAVVLAGCLASAPASGQVRVVRHGDDRLAGISEVDVHVRVTADHRAPCAMALAPLQALALAALREIPLTATLSEKTPSWHYSVLVTVTSTAAGRDCAASVATELIAQVEAIPDADRLAPAGRWGSLLVGELSLVRESALVTTPANTHEAAVQKVVREQIADLGGRIRAANP